MTRGVSFLAIDQGTTGSRAVLYDRNAFVVSSSYQEFPQIFPKPAWVEHNAEDIWKSVCNVLRSVFQKNGHTSKLTALGITNQRETVVFWDRLTGKPYYNAIVWQDRRTSLDCIRLRYAGYEKVIRSKTGLVLDPYFSATKIAWMINHVPGLRKKVDLGKVLVGTVDTWLLWKLTGGKSHATDPTNASRTLLFNIQTRQWDSELLKIFKIPRHILPEVLPSGGSFGVTAASEVLPSGIPILSVMGDQQAALYGQSCYHAGDIKNTYGTGCFVVMNLGSNKPKIFPHGLLGTLACDESGQSTYALEGAVFMGGAIMQWLRDSVKLIRSASDSEKIAMRVKDNGGVTMVPAFTGLGSPYWNADARGMISGMTRGTTDEHIIRAALESVAQQCVDVVAQMRKTGIKLTAIKVDGGATANHFLMQFQADLLRVPVLVSSQSELTAWGTAKLAARMAGISMGSKKVKYRRYTPQLPLRKVLKLRSVWKKEVQRALL